MVCAQACNECADSCMAEKEVPSLVKCIKTTRSGAIGLAECEHAAVGVPHHARMPSGSGSLVTPVFSSAGPGRA